MASERWWAVGDADGGLALCNRSRTVVRLAERASRVVDLGAFFAELEEAGVPFAYTEGLDEVYFTLLRGVHGDYFRSRIRLSSGPRTRPILVRSFVHELAHHVDEAEGLSDREFIEEERRRAGNRMDNFARENSEEYVAYGFETFYFGTEEQRERLREHNPRLHQAILRTHARYRAR
jgi:hypothetical protein